VRAKGALQSLHEAEFRVFSQFGDDGILQWLTHHVPLAQRVFAEFGVADYREATTRFLMMHDNWSGLVMDGDPGNVARIQQSEYFAQHELDARAVFIDRDNINGLLRSAGLPHDLGLLHIDLDGNDYWVWEAITVVSPVLLVLEYNSVFGNARAISVPYDARFRRTQAHASNLYFGASLPALHALSARKGYAFLGCNRAGNNAYFVRRDHLAAPLQELSLEEGYVRSKFRESRDATGALTCVTGDDRLALIRGLPVVNVTTGVTEAL